MTNSNRATGSGNAQAAGAFSRANTVNYRINAVDLERERIARIEEKLFELEQACEPLTVLGDSIREYLGAEFAEEISRAFGCTMAQAQRTAARLIVVDRSYKRQPTWRDDFHRNLARIARS